MRHLLALIALLAPATLSSQVPTPLSPDSPLIASALAHVKHTLGAQYMHLVSPLPGWTLHQAEVTTCANERLGACAWPWQYNYFLVVFQFRATSSADQQGLIVVPLDSAGALLPGYGPVGAPACASDPSLCAFPITADSARTLAVQAGLPKGVEPWTFAFRWGTSLGLGHCGACDRYFVHQRGGWPRYVWEITATTAGLPTATGVTLYLDASTGTSLDEEHWTAFQ